MKTLIIKCACLFFMLANLQAQDKTKTFDFKKGEVLDIFLLSTVEDSKELFDRYKKTSFPVAFEYTYQPQQGFSIKKLTLGTNTPSSFIFGKWASKEKKEGFIAKIVDRVPDFHQQRRALFPYFGLAYYEMQKDLKFSVNTEKFNVVTSFWKRDTKSLSVFFKEWSTSVVASGGKFILQLEDGKSPLGYTYDPDMVCIVEWKTEANFKQFEKQYPLSSYTSLKDIHQFVID